MLKPDSSRQQTTNSISYLERKVTCLPGVCLLGEEHYELEKKPKNFGENSLHEKHLLLICLSHTDLCMKTTQSQSDRTQREWPEA